VGRRDPGGNTRRGDGWAKMGSLAPQVSRWSGGSEASRPGAGVSGLLPKRSPGNDRRRRRRIVPSDEPQALSHALHEGQASITGGVANRTTLDVDGHGHQAPETPGEDDRELGKDQRFRLEGRRREIRPGRATAVGGLGAVAVPGVGARELPSMEGAPACRTQANVGAEGHGAIRSREAVHADDADVHKLSQARAPQLTRAGPALPGGGIARRSRPAKDPRAPAPTVVPLTPVAQARRSGRR
jgi:hypothetical protein